MRKTLLLFCTLFFCLFFVGCKETTETDITISANPTKMVYYEGETFDQTGMVVKVNLSDGTSREITDFTVDKEVLGANDTTVTVSYGDFNATITITVHAQSGITVTSNPTKLSYNVGDTFDPTGMVVKLNFDDDTSKVITNYTLNKTILAASDDKVTISYGRFSTTIDITVISQTGIEVTTNPTKLTYKVGESFDPTGMVVKLKYSDDSSEVITDYTVDKTVLTADDDKVTITYGNFSATVDITVIVETGISVTVNPTKLVYYEDDSFDPAGMEVKLNYSDDSSVVITDYTIDKTVLTADDDIVTISYGSFTTTINLTIHAATAITIESQPTKLEYIENEHFDTAGMVVKATYDDNTSRVITNYQIDVDVLTPIDREITVSYLGLTKKISINVKTVDGFDVIFTVEELLELIQKDALDGKYRLGADINGENVTWVKPKATLTGTFDGDNHTIKNVTFALPESRRGILFNVVNGGTVMNIRFNNISVTSSSQAAAIITGISNDNTTYENLEFVNCSVISTGNYVGLIFAQNENTAGTINVTNITVKNNCILSAAKYGAGVVGDIKGGSVLNMKNIDFAGTVEASGGQVGVLSGRDRGSTQNYENIRLSATISGANKLGMFGDGTTNSSTITIKNVIVLSLLITATSDTTVDAWKGAGSSVPTLINCYFVQGNVQVNLATKQSDTIASDINGTANGSVAVLETTVNFSFYQNELLFDFENGWEIDGDDIKIIGSSSNQVNEEDALESIQVITNQSKTYYVAGDEFSADGLVVKGIYTSGVEANISSENFTVDFSDFNKDVAGEYTIIVKVGDLQTTYTVLVVEAVDISVYDEFVVKTYLKGQSLSTSGLYVWVVMSDGSERQIDDYQITDNFNSTVAGVYQVTISYKDFADYSYNVTVVETKATVVDNKVEIVVDQDHTGLNGDMVDGKPVFKSMTAMIEYLLACKYDNAVRKIVYVKNGNYVEKLTFPSNLKNISLIGESKNGTILSYYVCSDHLQPNGSPWGTQGSSSVTIKSEGFEAINITFKNTFDYFNETKYANKQGVAVCVEADKVVFDNCAFYGVQDTLYAKWGRQYYVNCYIEGSVDFIFGNNAPALFENCQIHSIYRNSASNNGYITAAKGKHNGNDKGDYGYVFKNCNFTADEAVPSGTVALGRPWEADATVAFISCQMGAHISKVGFTDADGMERYEIMSGNSPLNADFKEYANIGDGALTEAVAGMTMLTPEQAAAYTAANIFASENGQITWSENWDGPAALTALRSLVD